MPTPTRPTTVSLVLGSGGARGLAHIGVIRWLEQHGLQVVSISGASIGALIGGVFAAGKLDVFEQWVRALTRPLMLSLMDLTWERGGLVKGDRFISTLKTLIGDRRIEDLPIAYTAVAAQLGEGKEVWLRSGSLFDAIRASISLPLMFTPYDHRGVRLIDGGVLNPVPIAPTFGDGSDMTIAVSLSGPPMIGRPATVRPEPATAQSDSLIDRIAAYIRFEQEADEIVPARIGPDWNAYDVAYLAFDAMQATIARQKLAAYPPDRLVEISRSACRTLEFDRAAEMIALGYAVAEAGLADLATRSDPEPFIVGAAP